MTRRSLKRAGYPPVVLEAKLKQHSRAGRMSDLNKRVVLAVAEELRRQLQATASPPHRGCSDRSEGTQ